MEQARYAGDAEAAQRQRLQERLDRADALARDVQDMAIHVRVLMEQMQRAQQDLTAIVREIRAIRARPMAHMDAIRNALISSAVATLISIVAGAISFT